MRVRSLPAMMVIGTILPAVAPGQTPPHPPLAVRLSVERHSVVVQVHDRSAGPIAWGMGAIVGERHDRYEIATAAHILAGHRADGSTRIRVLPHRHVHWIEAELVSRGVVTGTADEASDYAFLRIPQQLTEFVPGALGASLHVAPSSVAEPGTQVWAIGFDSHNEERVWKPGKVQGRDDWFVSFAGPEVRSGFSGGLLCTSSGALAMTLSVGRKGDASKALRLDALARASEQAGVTPTIATRPITEALLYCKQHGLHAALYWHANSRWVATRVLAQDGIAFTGTWVTYGEDNYLRSPGKSGSFTLRPADATVVLQMQVSPALGAIHFAPTAEHRVAGHLLLKARTAESDVYLAVPTEDCELLPVSVIASRHDKGIPGEMLTHDITVRSGLSVPFGVALRGDFHYGEEVVYGFLIPERWRGRALRLVGNAIVADDDTGRQRPLTDPWHRVAIHVRDAALGKDVAMIVRNAENPHDSAFEVDFELSDRECDVVLRAPGNVPPGAIVMQAPVVFCEPR